MTFDARAESEKIIEFIRSYYKKNSLKGAVIGLSGGKDSAVAAALFCEALGAENVVGAAMPCHSEELDLYLAKKVADFYGMQFLEMPLTSVYDEFLAAASSCFDIDKRKADGGIFSDSNINLKPRLRMSSLYYLAAALSAKCGGGFLVAGTSNKSEIFVGYFTKGADNVNDINVLADLTVEEVIQIGEVLKVPKEVLYRVPSDGLTGVSDEKRLGVSYRQISDYMINPLLVEKEAARKIARLHSVNSHKSAAVNYKKSVNVAERIGMFGGSFNPVHLSHTGTAKRLLDEGVLDKVVFVPVGDDYSKKELADACRRAEMLKLAINGDARMELCDFEIQNGTAFTYQTLAYLQEKYPAAQIALILGSDNFNELHLWKRPQEIMDRYKIIVVTRDGVASSDIRKELKTNTVALSGVIDKDVLNYIKKNKLYGC